MAITLDFFKNNYEPDSGEIQFFTSGSTVNAAIVSKTSCDSQNIVEALQSMTVVGFVIDGTVYRTEVIERLDRRDYFYLKVNPFETATTGSFQSCGIGLYAYDVSSRIFNNSEFNPLIGNATVQESIGYIYDVDRKKSQTSPGNIIGILSGSAQPANIQLSNYSITGLVNSKYNGSKTNIEEYGTVPLISGRIFRGANYTLGTETTLICSLLYNSSFEEGETENDFFIQRTVNQDTTQEFLFASNPKLTITPTNNIPQIRTQELDLTLNAVSLNDTDTKIDVQGVDGPKIQPGDILKLVSTGGNNIEYVKVTRFVAGELGVSDAIFCRRGYRSEIEGGFLATTHDSSITFTRIAGDIIYKLERNTFYKLSESLITIVENEKVFYIDEDGSLFLEVKDCALP